MKVKKTRTFREILWMILGDSQSRHPLAKLDDIVISGAILLSIGTLVLSSNANFLAIYSTELFLITLITDIFFLVEYILRTWAAGGIKPYRGKRIWKYILSPMAIIDLMALLPIITPFVGGNLEVLRMFRIFRILRVLKFARYSPITRQLIEVFKMSYKAFLVSGGFILILLFFYAGLLWTFENEAQPDKFPDIISSIWPAAVTLTTVGYGDVFPVTPVGRIITVLALILGGSMVIGLPISIIAGNYQQLLEREKKICPHCGKKF